MRETAIATVNDRHELAPASPLDMLLSNSAALADLDVEKVKDLILLKREEDLDRSRREFAGAFLAVQSEIPVVPEKGYNDSTKSAYAVLADVSKALRPVLLRNGFSCSVSATDGAPEGMTRIQLRVRHTGGHEEFHHMDAPIDNVGMRGAPTKTKLHGMKSSLTYCTRTLKLSVFDIITGEDDDGNAGGAPMVMVTPEQVGELADLAKTGEADIPAFCEWLAVPALAEIPAERFEEARMGLQQKVVQHLAQRHRAPDNQTERGGS